MRVCDITGKKAHIAMSVSHAHNRTKKRQLPNLQDKRIFVPEAGRWIKLTLSTRAIRTINKIGLRALCTQYDVNFDKLISTKHP
ncbi:MAG: 50S ribosomal protein L28 [Myxococcota bacterium]